ncbi:MAG: ribosome maturation factor RimP [Thermodesulfovibrionales bacterium]
MATVKERLSELAGPVAGQLDVDIVDIELAGNARRTLVRVFLDKPGGVTLEDCAKFSRALSAVLDVEDPISTRYVLEVSSPGLDRPLKTKKDFYRSIGKLARIVTREKIDGEAFLVGRIQAANEHTVAVLVDGSREVRIPFEQISKARLEIELS